MGLSAIASLLLKFGLALVVLNEIRGIIMAAPLIWGLYTAGGSAWDWFITLCLLAGIAVSVIVPLMLAAWAKEKLEKKNASAAG
ncbi:hypothetical protein [Altererythrobacter sp. MF3-039]|uniref:hypothetical protein n=1 Tax=Altererythrobacter sp. MF3-039 TaxID=3252901 RepID=UPI00390C632B